MDKNETIKEYILGDSDDDNKPEEVEKSELKNVPIIDSSEEKEKIESTENGNEEFKIHRLVLNWYWIQLVSSIGLALYLIVYEAIILLGGRVLFNLFKEEFSFLLDAITFYFEKIGAKWLFMITISTHLSIGFFCLINFSYTLKETKKPLKFFIFKYN